MNSKSQYWIDIAQYDELIKRAVFMKRLALHGFVAIITALLLSSCGKSPAGTPHNNIPPPPVSSTAEPMPEPVRKRPALEALNATSIDTVRYIDDETAYVYAYNRDMQTHTLWEGILAKYNPSTGDLKVLHRSPTSTDSKNNMQAAILSDGIEVVFNGAATYYILRDGTVKYVPLEEKYKWEAFLDIKNNRLAYKENETNNVLLLDIPTTKTQQLYNAELIEAISGASGSSAFFPQISPDGKRVLLQKTRGSGTSFERVICCDLLGNPLYQTDEIDVVSDSLYSQWFGNSIFTLQAYDTLPSGEAGDFSLFTLYDENGAEKNTFALHCKIDYLQQTPKEPARLVSFFYNNYDPSSDSFHYSLGTVDLLNGTANIVYDADGIASSHDLSPSGEKMIWLEEDNICDMSLADMQKTEISKIKLQY